MTSEREFDRRLLFFTEVDVSHHLMDITHSFRTLFVHTYVIEQQIMQITETHLEMCRGASYHLIADFTLLGCISSSLVIYSVSTPDVLESFLGRLALVVDFLFVM